MPNILQKALYNVSAAAPLLIMFSIVWWLQGYSGKISLVLVLIAIVLIVIFLCSFHFSKQKLPPVGIRIDEFSPHDNWIAAYIISYIMPFASMVIKEINLYMSVMVAIAIIAIAPFVNSVLPNPILFFCGYHFFLLKAEHGASDMLLISKRKLRSKKEIKYVQRVFEFLLIDEGIK